MIIKRAETESRTAKGRKEVLKDKRNYKRPNGGWGNRYNHWLNSG